MKTTPIKFPEFDITKDYGRVGREKYGQRVFAHHKCGNGLNHFAK